MGDERESVPQRRLRLYLERKAKAKARAKSRAEAKPQKTVASRLVSRKAVPAEVDSILQATVEARRTKAFKKCQSCKKPIDPDETGDERLTKGANGRFYHHDCLELAEWRKTSEHAKPGRGGKVPHAVNGRIIRSTRGLA